MIDVFKVGVHIGMTTNATQALSAMLAQLTGLHIATGKLQGMLGNVKMAAIGAGMAFVGWEVGKGLLAATKHAESLNHELIKLKIGAGLSDAQTHIAETRAFEIARAVPGLHVHDATKIQRELYGVLGDFGEADHLAPLVALGSQAVSNYVDKDTDLAAIAVRALELRGHITKDGKVDPKEFAEEFNNMVRSIVASEGLIDPQKLFMFIRQAGPAARSMNAEEMWGKMPAIMNALGSGPAGTAMMSLYSQMVGHVVAGQRVAIAMEQAGMLTPGKWRVERGGKVRMDQDAVPDQAGFMDHPLTWLHDHLGEMRNKKGADGKPIDTVGIVQQIFQLSSRATSARLISDVDMNWPVIQAEEARFKRMPDIAEIAKEQNASDAGKNLKNLSAAWDNFMTALGKPGIPILITVVGSLTTAINWMQETIIKHPNAAAGLFYLSGGIAALCVLSGGMMILSFALRPLAGGLSLLVGIPGIATAGTAISSVATGLAALIAPIAAIVGILAVGSANETPENRKALDDLAKQRRGAAGGPNGGTTDGYDAAGRPITSPYIAPGGGSVGKSSGGDVYLDGRKVGRIVSDHMANDGSRPPTGSMTPDWRVSPLMPGMGGGYQ